MIEILKNCLPVLVTTCEALDTVAIGHCRLRNFPRLYYVFFILMIDLLFILVWLIMTYLSDNL